MGIFLAVDKLNNVIINIVSFVPNKINKSVAKPFSLRPSPTIPIFMIKTMTHVHVKAVIKS